MSTGSTENGTIALPFVDGFAEAGTTIVNGQLVTDGRSRLEREVAAAVKDLRQQTGPTWDWIAPSGAYGGQVQAMWERIESTVDALIDFEESQIKK